MKKGHASDINVIVRQNLELGATEFPVHDLESSRNYEEEQVALACLEGRQLLEEHTCYALKGGRNQ